jgi:adenosylcobinamide-GDP ribazoletransferase
VGVLRGAPAATGEGLGADYAAGVTGARAVGSVAAGGAIGALALGGWVLLAAAAVTVAALACATLARRKIGGVSGDVLGAVEQLGETAVLLVAAALVRHGVTFPWWRR